MSPQEDTRHPVVLITGGGSGIGAAVAERLCGSHSVAIRGHRLGHLERVANATGAAPLVADVADPQSAEAVAWRLSPAAS